MKKILAFIFSVMVLLNLFACGTEAEENSKTENIALNKPTGAWLTKVSKLYPLRANGLIEAITACENYIFVAGKDNQRFSIVRVSYSTTNSEIGFGEPQKMEIPGHYQNVRAISASCIEDKLYLLIEISSGRIADGQMFQVWRYNTDGGFESSIALDYTPERPPLAILALPDGVFGITSSTSFTTFRNDGEKELSLSLTGSELLPAMRIRDTVVLQSICEESGKAELNYADFEKEALITVKSAAQCEVNRSVCESTVVDGMINDGTKLFSLDEGFELAELYDWYDITGDYGFEYRNVLQLSFGGLLVVNSRSSSLEYINTEYSEDSRELISIAACASSRDIAERLQIELDKVSTDYNVNVKWYCNDENGIARLIRDLDGGNSPDLLVSEGYTLNDALKFADLYELIDNDPELCREDFLPEIITGLERNGRLPQIWTRFGLFSAIARGPLAYGPEPLRLKDCQVYLDEQAYPGTLYDEYITKENLLSLLADNIIKLAWNKEKKVCNFAGKEIKELIDQCLNRPELYDFSSNSEIAESEVLSWRDISLDYLGYLEHENIAYRFFSGNNGGDCFSQIAAYYGSCYMIPENCRSIEKSWSFLRELLKPKYQIDMCVNGFSGLPINCAAFEELLSAYLTNKGSEQLTSAIENAAISDYQSVRMREIFVEKMRPYICGRADYDTALKYAQNSIELFLAERA